MGDAWRLPAASILLCVGGISIADKSMRRWPCRWLCAELRTHVRAGSGQHITNEDCCRLRGRAGSSLHEEILAVSSRRWTLRSYAVLSVATPPYPLVNAAPKGGARPEPDLDLLVGQTLHHQIFDMAAERAREGSYKVQHLHISSAAVAIELCRTICQRVRT